MSLKENKGQALVEFVIILPIFIFMMFALFDIGKVLFMQNNLESRIDEVISSYQNNKSEENIKKNLDLDKDNIILNIKQNSNLINFELTREVDIITPGLNLFLKNQVKTKRVIYNE